MAENRQQSNAKVAKNDEFYTQYADIKLAATDDQLRVDIARVIFTDGDTKVFAEALRPRFDPLFPRAAETTNTRIRRADGK